MFSAEIGNLKNISLSVVDDWMRRLEASEEFAINSIDEEFDYDAEDCRILQAQVIHSLLAEPLKRGDVIVGFVGVDNPHDSIRDLALLRAVSAFVLEELEKRRIMDELQRISYIDALTGLRNRNQYMKALRRFEVDDAENARRHRP